MLPLSSNDAGIGMTDTYLSENARLPTCLALIVAAHPTTSAAKGLQLAQSLISACITSHPKDDRSVTQTKQSPAPELGLLLGSNPGQNRAPALDPASALGSADQAEGFLGRCCASHLARRYGYAASLFLHCSHLRYSEINFSPSRTAACRVLN